MRGTNHAIKPMTYIFDISIMTVDVDAILKTYAQKVGYRLNNTPNTTGLLIMIYDSVLTYIISSIIKDNSATSIVNEFDQDKFTWEEQQILRPLFYEIEQIVKHSLVNVGFGHSIHVKVSVVGYNLFVHTQAF